MVVVAACERRTVEVVDALRSIGDDALLAPSALPDWSRLTVACHLRYGARALGWITDAALAGRPTSYYPDGRATQRPSTLHPADGESAADVVAALGARSDELHQRWSMLTPEDWRTVVNEPDDNPDLGPLPMRSLLVLRLTEVEVHATDLDLGLADWSEPFVHAALPVRIRRLTSRPPTSDADGSWLLTASDGPTYVVRVRASTVVAEPASSSTPADAVIEGSSRDLVALLLGRPTLQPLRYTGNVDLGRAFNQVFPGP